MTMPSSVGGEGDLALVGFDFASEQLEQRRFARAIGADDPDAIAALDAKVEVLDDRAVAEALADMVGDDHRFRADVVVGQAELGDAGTADHRRARGPHLHQLFESALVAAAPRGHAALQPVCFQLQLRIELFRGARFFGIDGLHPRIEAAEADFLAPDATAVEPQGLTRQAGQEGAVVADGDEGAGEAREPAFEPVDRCKVEVVGRFVEQQHIGILRQRARDCGAATLTPPMRLRLRAPCRCQAGRRSPPPHVFGGRVRAADRIVHQRRIAREIGLLFQQHDVGAGDDRPLALVGLDASGRAT